MFSLWHNTGRSISKVGILGFATLWRTASLKPSAQTCSCIRRYSAEGKPAEGGGIRLTRQQRLYGTTWQASPASEQEGVATKLPAVWDFEDNQTYAQEVDLDKLVHPILITAYIKALKTAALSSLGGPDQEASLTRFLIRMDDLLAAAAPRMNYINFAAVVTASAQLWSAARKYDTFTNQADIHEGLVAVYQQCLQGLQGLQHRLVEMSAWEIRTVVWASATLGCNPDAVIPGMLHHLTFKFAQLTDATKEDQRPNAQACANLLWALATMRYPAAAEVVDAVCDRMYSLLQSTDQHIRPNAQHTANTFWALMKLKHAPSHDVASALLINLSALCQIPDLQPRSQSVSNCLLACAELGLSVSSTCLEALLKYLLEMHVSQVDYQHYCNTAWSLAVMRFLDFKTFALFLNKLTTKQLSARQLGRGRAQPNTWEARQLYQALAWLQPSPGSEQLEAWSCLHLWLQAVVLQPPTAPVNSPGQAELWHALDMQGMPFKAQVPCWMYWADAVLTPYDSSASPAILVLERPEDGLTNMPSRLLGHVALRNKMLEPFGTVVTIPYYPDSSSVASMAIDIEAAVEAKTGLPLDSFRY